MRPRGSRAAFAETVEESTVPERAPALLDSQAPGVLCPVQNSCGLRYNRPYSSTEGYEKKTKSLALSQSVFSSRTACSI